MSKKPISREYRVYLALWRKAYNERDSDLPPVTINASTYNLAISMRQGLYRAIAPYRYGEAFDSDLAQALELFIIRLPKTPTPQGFYQVVIHPRVTLNEMELQLAELGIGEADLLTQEEQMASRSLDKLLDGPVPATEASNPFYRR